MHVCECVCLVAWMRWLAQFQSGPRWVLRSSPEGVQTNGIRLHLIGARFSPRPSLLLGPGSGIQPQVYSTVCTTSHMLQKGKVILARYMCSGLLAGVCVACREVAALCLGACVVAHAR